VPAADVPGEVRDHLKYDCRIELTLDAYRMAE
jgi:hypothetical protein